MKSQPRLFIQAGAGYSDHLNTSLGVNFNNKKFLSVSFGSNFFSKTNYFANYTLSYENICSKQILKKWSPNLSFATGYTIFSDDNYRWKLLHITPCMGLSRKINQYIILSINGGVIISKELYVERLKLLDIGWYRHFLPEFNVKIKYTICAKD